MRTEWQPSSVPVNIFLSLLKITLLPFNFIQPAVLIMFFHNDHSQNFALIHKLAFSLPFCFSFIYYYSDSLLFASHIDAEIIFFKRGKKKKRQKVCKRLSPPYWLTTSHPQRCSIEYREIAYSSGSASPPAPHWISLSQVLMMFLHHCLSPSSLNMPNCSILTYLLSFQIFSSFIEIYLTYITL